MIAKNPKSVSELRFDLVSKDWVVIATSRAKRPEEFKKCPFCNLEIQEPPVLIFSHGQKISFKPGDKIPEDWTTIVIPNKYPAFRPSRDLAECSEGDLYKRMNAVGFHELVVTRSHERQLAQLSTEEIKEVFDVYQLRYLALMKEKFVNYISIFHNHGREAGASVNHSHSQIITTPLIDIDLKKALANAQEYQKIHQQCAYCLMNDWERKVKERIIFENQEFLAVCPFTSKTAFEIVISPKKHLSYFEKITEEEKKQLAEILKISLSALSKAQNDPPYNFYLHTAPCDRQENYDAYHWHWTVLPKINIPAGFEIGTHMEISSIAPEKAAQILRKNI